MKTSFLSITPSALVAAIVLATSAASCARAENRSPDVKPDAKTGVTSDSKSGSSKTGGVRLNDPDVDVDVRVKEAKALGASKSPAAIDVLLEGLDIRHDALHAAIVASLKQQKADVVLVQRVVDEKRPAAERVAAFAGLRVLKPKDAPAKIAPLLLVAGGGKDEAVRIEAAHTLATYGAAAGEAQLITALSDVSSKVRYFAAVALGELKTKAAKDAVVARAKVETDMVVQDGLDQAQQRHNR